MDSVNVPDSFVVFVLIDPDDLWLWSSLLSIAFLPLGADWWYRESSTDPPSATKLLFHIHESFLCIIKPEIVLFYLLVLSVA